MLNSTDFSATFNDAAESRRVNIWFDGACEPVNPGGTATAGWQITDDQGRLIGAGYGVVAQGSGATNNLAEWQAMAWALVWLRDNMALPGVMLAIYGDSKLVVNQLAGRWACKAPHLQPLLHSCRAILDELNPRQWAAIWIPRDQNYVADALARAAYEEATGLPFPERHR